MKDDLFPDRLVTRLNRLSLVVKGGKLGHLKGHHRSKKIGTSLDFSDFRQYHPGDDIRHIDWNVYARTEQPFIKQFLDEQEMRVHIVIDPTKSMSLYKKWAYARQLAMGISTIALAGGDTVSMSTWSAEKDFFIRKKGVGQRAAMARFLTMIEEPNVTTAFTNELFTHLPKAVSVLFIITDGLEETKNWEPVFRRLRSICKDIRLIGLQSPEEEAPILEGDFQLIDIENESNVEVTVTANATQQYIEKREAHFSRLHFLARKYGIEFLQIDTAENVMDVFTKQMRKHRWFM